MPEHPGPPAAVPGPENAHTRRHQADQLAKLAEALDLEDGPPALPWDTSSHERVCRVCRLAPPDLAELRVRYLAWEPLRAMARDVAELVELTEDSARESIRRHAAVFLWDLARVANLAGAYSRIIAAGLENADETANVRDALAALRQLGQPRQPAARDAGDPGTTAPGMVETYEARIRRIRRSSESPGEVDRSTRSLGESRSSPPVPRSPVPSDAGRSPVPSGGEPADPGGNGGQSDPLQPGVQSLPDDWGAF